MLYFCTVTITINVFPLLMFWSWWISMVRPCRFSTLHWGLRGCIWDPLAVRYGADIQLGTRDLGCILQPPLPGIHWFHADDCHPVLPRTNQPVPLEHQQRGDPETGGTHTETIARCYKELKKGDLDQNVSLWVKYFVVTYIWKIESSLLNKYTVPKSFCYVVPTFLSTPIFAGVTNMLLLGQCQWISKWINK